MEGNQNINFARKTKILEGNQKFWKETKNFGRKPKSSEGNKKFWEVNKIKIWKETKKFGKEILTPLGHHRKGYIICSPLR